MRTVTSMTFAFLCLCLLAGCAAAGDAKLPISAAGSDEVRPTDERSEATSVPPAVVPGENAENAVPPATALPAASAAVSPSGPETSSPAASPDQPPAAEEYTFDPSLWQQSVARLSSFRQKAVLEFTSADSRVHGKVTYEGEGTLNPPASRSLLRVQGQGAAQLPSNRVEVTWINGQVWVKVGRKPWVSVPEAAVQSEYGSEMVSVADLLPFIHHAGRVLPDERVNGIPSRHYVYDVGNLQPDVGMSAAQGDLWVARDGGYVVRLSLEGQGTYYDTYSTSGSLRLVYDLYDVNVPLTIAAPR